MCVDAMENWFQPGRSDPGEYTRRQSSICFGGELRLDVGVGAADGPERLASSVVCSIGILLKL
jgi:hypothetical protein